MLRFVAVAYLLSVLAISSASVAEQSKGGAAGQSLDIANLIFEVRTQLIEAEKLRREAGRETLFYTHEFELELNFVVEKSAKGQAGGLTNHEEGLQSPF